LQMFAQLDDYDVIYAIKQWSSSSDFVLRNLAQMILERRLPKVKLKNKPIPHEKVEAKLAHIIKKHQLTNHEASYFVFTGETQNLAYKLNSQPIKILYKNGKLKDVSKASDQLNLKALSKLVTKHYFCYPKNNY